MSRKLYGISLPILIVTIYISMARGDDKPTPPTSPDQQQAMDAFKKATSPGPPHEWLKAFEGDFNSDVKLFNPDGSVQSTTRGTSHNEMVLGGRYLQMHYSGEVDMGQVKIPFKGIGLTGYDNAKKKYVNVWVDEMSTGMMMTEGTANGDVITLEGTASDPISGKPINVKEISTKVDKDHHKYELYMSGDDGKMAKVLEIVYTRKGA